MRERRRLRLAARQLQLARQARLEAMGALANALSEEDRSTSLARRSQILASEYAAKDGADTAHDLRQQIAFVQSLTALAQQSDAARRDAQDQAAWHAQTLAQAEQRAKGMEKHVSAARKDVATLIERREHSEPSAVARKLQRSAGHSTTSPQPRGMSLTKD